MQIERMETPGEEWDAFVCAQPGATLAHAAAWARVLRAGYGLEPHYLAARDSGGGLRGVLPLVRFRTLRGRAEWVSLPFLDTGGVLAATPETEAALLDAALDRMRADRAGALELRQLGPLRTRPGHSQVDRVGMVRVLSGDAEAEWKALDARVRNQTRKAERSGLALAEPGHLAGFYEPFAANMRDLGSPVHARAFFEAMGQAFGDALRFVVTCDGERPVGGLVAIHYAGTVTVPWASTLRSERKRCPNNQIYWDALRWSIERGACLFDFGRSEKGSGSWRFKRGWGASERPLHWLRLAPDGAVLPYQPVSDTPLLAGLSRVWQRLPVSVTARLGPRLRRRLAN